MPLDRARLLPEALSFVGTPYHHEGRLKGVGVDCAGLLACIYRECGGEFGDDVRGLAQTGDNFEVMCGQIEQVCDLIAGAIFQPLDVLVFRSRSILNHVGLVTSPTTMIHAHSGIGWVVNEPISDAWLRRLVRVYRLKEGI